MFAGEFVGMVNFREPVPEALTLASMAGAAAPAALPELSPNVPAIIAAESKSTHLITPGWAHLVGKSWLPTIGGNNVTILDALAVPPGPVQERLNVLLLLKKPVDSFPEIALIPDQPPEAMHDVALVDDQLSVEDAPLTTVVGFAASDTVGTGGGGGVPCTATVVEALAVPRNPAQERLKLVLPVKAGVGWLPEAALGPDQPPEATHDVASVDDQESVDVSPRVTVVGFAASDTVGITAALAPPERPPPSSSVVSPQAAITKASAGMSHGVLMRGIERFMNGPGQRCATA